MKIKLSYSVIKDLLINCNFDHKTVQDIITNKKSRDSYISDLNYDCNQNSDGLINLDSYKLGIEQLNNIA